jgi:hypothetical protein
MFPAQAEFAPPPPPGFAAWHLVTLVGAGLLFFLLLAVVALWFKDRKGRRLHDEQMQALEHGLVPPDWASQLDRHSRRVGWLWLALGLPVFIAFALGFGTFMLVDGGMRSGRNMTDVIVVIWLVGGVVGLAAVVMGGLGLMAAQRRQQGMPPPLDYPSVRPAPPPIDKGRDPATERIWKQESP